MAPLAAARMDRPDAETIAAEVRKAPACTGTRCTCGRRASARTARRWAKRELSSDAEVWLRRSIDAEYAALPASERAALEAEFAPLVDDFRRLWLTRDRPGGLHDSIGRFERLLAVYRRGCP